MINAIVACDIDGGIGKNNGIPWDRISCDMARFKKKTLNNVIVMGANTWNSVGMPNPLPKRYNVVITSNNNLNPVPDLYLHDNILLEIKTLEQSYSNIWILGGESIFDQTIDIIDNWHITRINKKYECDTFIPLIWNFTNYLLVSSEKVDDISFDVFKKLNT